MSDEGFLSRWSRRKRAVEAGLTAEEPPAEVAPDAAPALPVPEEPPFDITTLPSLDSLTIDSDFAAFLRKEVPEALKRAALRKAWALDPAIRDFVGPADYAWDYNAPDGVPGASLDLTGNLKDMLAQAFGGPSEDAKADDPPPTLAEDTVPHPKEAATEALAVTTAPPDEPAAEPEAVAAIPRHHHGSALPN